MRGEVTQGAEDETGERLLSWLYETLPLNEPAVDLLLATLLVILGWFVAKGVVRLSARAVARRFGRPSVTRTALQAIRVFVFLLFVAAATALVGVEGELLLSASVFAAVLAVVLAPIVGSFVSGLFVLADQPFEIGDMIELVDEGTKGYVDDITLRYTKLFTLDNTFIVIPNNTIRDRDIINYSAEDERTRRSLRLTVTYEGDLGQARALMERAARNVDGVVTGGPAIRIGTARYPAAPTCYIENYGDDGIELLLRYWVEEPYKLTTISSKVQENVWAALVEADVEIAYPHTHLVFDETSGEASVAVRDAALGPTEADPTHPDPGTTRDASSVTSGNEANLGEEIDRIDPERSED